MTTLASSSAAWLRTDRRRSDALAERHRTLGAPGEAQLRTAIERLWLAPHPLRDAFDPAERRACLDALLFGRLNHSRRAYIPWLDATAPLDGARVLEIGCGSGPGTVSLAEQGARVIGADVDAGHLELGRLRMALYRLPGVQLIDILGPEFAALPPSSFDWVVFFASLEHMLPDERITLLRRADALLRPGAHLAIVECPNRLWPLDQHTSALPFFDWLPHEVAFRYARFSRRSFVRALGEAGDTRSFDLFMREGRGASYHELQLAFGEDFGGYTVARSLWEHQVRSLPLRRWRRALAPDDDARMARLLARRAPQVHPGFFEPTLNLVLRKSA